MIIIFSSFQVTAQLKESLGIIPLKSINKKHFYVNYNLPCCKILSLIITSCL